MKHGTVTRDLWLDPRFKTLTPQVKLVVLYVLTSPYGNSAHLFRIGPSEIALACGLSPKAARLALNHLCSVEFIAYDFEHELMWLELQMLAELGESLKPEDNRIKFLASLCGSLPKCAITADFLTRFSAPYHLNQKGACKGTSRGHTSQGQGQRQ